MAGRLDCSTTSAFFTWKCSGNRLCDATNASRIVYDRRLDDISEAEIEIPIGGDADGPACCECYADLEPFCHQVNIVREGEGVVWSGPIVEVEYQRDLVIVRAKDKVAWLQVRINEVDISYLNNTTVPLTDIALQIATVAMADDGDSPCFLDCIINLGDGLPDGTDRSRLFPAFGGPTAFDDFQAMAESGVDYTVVKNCLILGSEAFPVRPITLLTDAHILGNLSIRKDGNLMANRVFVPWSNPFDGIGWEDCPTCTAQGAATCPCPAVADAPQQCYGAVERILGDNLGVPTLDAAQTVAQTYVNSASIAPRLIEFPPGTRLSPDTPWKLNDMIPGQRVDVALTQYCIPIAQSFRLQKVTVEDTPAGEAISIDLGIMNSISGVV